jgi:uncharacterized membrane protein YvlD (DUF360 family)
MPNVPVFGREPAVVLAAVAGLIQVVSAFVLPLTLVQQGVLNAIVVAAIGVWTAAKVAQDQLLPAVVGFVQAGLSLALAFGVSMTPENQSVLMGAVATALALFVRTQVTAKVPASGAPGKPELV